MKRDPRIDPRGGDRIQSAPQFERIVIHRTPYRVHYESYVRDRYAGSYTDSLKHWREDLIGSNVIHVAEVAE